LKSTCLFFSVKHVLTGAKRREFSGMIHFITSNVIIPATPSNPSSNPRIAAFQQQRCLFIQLQRLEPGAEVTAHRDALPYGGDRIAPGVLEGSSQVRVGRPGVLGG
jgi:hypothetical protein